MKNQQDDYDGCVIGLLTLLKTFRRHWNCEPGNTCRGLGRLVKDIQTFDDSPLFSKVNNDWTQSEYKMNI